jgi:hypothetical protein
MFGFFLNSNDVTAAQLRRVERKLDLILAHLGIEYKDDNPLPPDARELADRGDKIAAIKAFRQNTGAGLAEAKHAVESYLGRR